MRQHRCQVHEGGSCSCEMSRLRGFMEACSVLLLAEQPAHGYELLSRLAKFGLQAEGFDAGTLYRILRRLESEGILASEWSTEGSGAARRVYQVTPDGLDLLRSWRTAVEDMSSHLSEFLRVCGQILDREEG
jgi:PadR family transcriptional regulator, regulatory protein PadR